MEIYLVRHGKTVWNEQKKMQGHGDSELIELGKNQASLLGKKFDSEPFDNILVSPLGRTIQTASLITPKQVDNFTRCDWLKEIDLGSWEGSKYDELPADATNSKEHFWNSPHLFDKSVTGGEDFSDVVNRAVKGTLDFVENADEDSRNLFVSHTITIKAIINYFENRDLSEFWSDPFIAPASLTILKFTKKKFNSFLKYGCTAHYDEKILS